jgi:hypothetical protein
MDYAKRIWRRFPFFSGLIRARGPAPAGDPKKTKKKRKFLYFFLAIWI